MDVGLYDVDYTRSKLNPPAEDIAAFQRVVNVSMGIIKDRVPMEDWQRDVGLLGIEVGLRRCFHLSQACILRSKWLGAP